ncbi:MAG: GAF domain-containing protein [Candidatus Heimdallarchaeota archaeon]|nr:MAG: GAF domain-containing protein [Candidatus Heimdallarchaeota archaeon]
MENKELQYFRLFRDVCKVINSTLNLEEVLKLITENVVNVLNVKACTIFLLDTVENRLKVSASYGLTEAYLKKGPIDADKSIPEVLEGKPVLIIDAQNDPRIQYPKEKAEEGIASILSVPISVKAKVIGVLRIYTSQPRKFSDDESEFISGLAEMGGIAIDNARMHDHLKADHERLINEVHRWFEFGRTT